jgi:hypothetical protein
MNMRNIIAILAFIALTGTALAQSVTITVTPQSSGGGAGPCTSNDSPYVPAGYKCVPGSSDEFNGSAVDTGKWTITGSPGGQGPGTGVNESGGVVTMSMTQMGPPSTFFNGSTSGGLVSKFPIPDAPMYLEFRRTLNPSVVSLMQFWIRNCGSGPCTGEETDVDMGQFNGCNQNNVDPGASPTGLCSGMFDWNNGSNFGFFNGSASGAVSVDSDQQPHTIMLQRLPDPAPNGTVRYGVDGVWVKTLTDMPDARWIYPSKFLNGGATQDEFELDLFCANGNGCNFNQSIAWDYLRVYTPSGLPNGY